MNKYKRITHCNNEHSHIVTTDKVKINLKFYGKKEEKTTCFLFQTAPVDSAALSNY